MIYFTLFNSTAFSSKINRLRLKKGLNGLFIGVIRGSNLKDKQYSYKGLIVSDFISDMRK